MGIFDAIQNFISGASGSIGDAVGGLADVPVLQDIQDQTSTLTDGATDTVTSVTEQAQTAVEDITTNLGL
jgi:hypothetical protein